MCSVTFLCEGFSGDRETFTAASGRWPSEPPCPEQDPHPSVTLPLLTTSFLGQKGRETGGHSELLSDGQEDPISLGPHPSQPQHLRPEPRASQKSIRKKQILFPMLHQNSLILCKPAEDQ